MGENSRVKELENVLLNQIEKLNDDSIFDTEEKAKLMFEKSRVISDLSQNFTDIQRLKLEVVRYAETNRTLYTNYLGIEQWLELTIKINIVEVKETLHINWTKLPPFIMVIVLIMTFAEAVINDKKGEWKVIMILQEVLDKEENA